MNFFLYINRKLVFFSGTTIVLIFLIIIIYKQINLYNNDLSIIDNNVPNADIAEPKFSINNSKKKIFVSAKEGNFLNNNEILLKDNVRFKSNDFIIETDKVIFNRNSQTAESKSKSIFKSKNTTISSDGFDINDQGNKITFYGNSFIILK